MLNQVVKRIYFQVDADWAVYYESIVGEDGYKESQAHVVPIGDVGESDTVIDMRTIIQEDKN